MNQERLQLYCDLTSYGIGLEKLKEIPGRVLGISPCHKNSFMIKTTKQPFFLWVHQGREESLVDQLQIMEYCHQNGFQGFLELQPLRNGSLYGKLDERNWFYLTEAPELQRFSYHNTEYLKSTVKILTDFRTLSQGWSAVNCRPGLKGKNDLSEKMIEMYNYLKSFGVLATYRINPTQFDKYFLNKLPQLEKSATEAIALIKESKYFELLANSKTNGIIINDYARSNLGVDSQLNIKCLRVKNFRYEVPVIDLAVLLLKSGRSNNWSGQWFAALFEEYQKQILISPDEFQILKAYLIFPWNLYRLASRYYLNRVEWPLHFFIEKLERLIKDEDQRIKFIGSLA